MFNGMAIKSLYEAWGPQVLSDKIREALAEGELKPTAHDFSIRGLAEAICGPDWVRTLGTQPGSSGYQSLTEAGGAVDSSAFSNITGQIVYSRLLESYKAAPFIGDQLVTVIPTVFNGEKIPGMGTVASEGDEIAEGMPYPRAGFGERFVQTPATQKRGLIVPVTREAIFFDRTGLLLDQAGTVGERLGLRREKKILKTVLGIDNSYNEGGTAFNTYGAPVGTWTNLQAANELLDWTNIQTMEQLFVSMTDPITGDPIVIAPTTMLVMPPKLHTARQIVRATTIESTPALGAGVTRRFSANTIDNYTILTSPLAQALLGPNGANIANPDKLWLFGDPKKAFAYMENWGMTVERAPDNAADQWDRDIVVQYKASERGVPAVRDPRYITKATG